MNIITVVFLALGLAMDAFAVSVSNTMGYKNINQKQMIAIAGAFGIAQGIMPILGWNAGRLFEVFIIKFDHYITLILLAIVGINMIKEAVIEIRSTELKLNDKKQISSKIIITQAIATSIDALAVGIGFISNEVNIYTSCIIISIITFICCLIGLILGKKLGKFLGEKAQILGGVILITIGIKIFIEHA